MRNREDRQMIMALVRRLGGKVVLTYRDVMFSPEHTLTTWVDGPSGAITLELDDGSITDTVTIITESPPCQMFALPNSAALEIASSPASTRPGGGPTPGPPRPSSCAGNPSESPPDADDRDPART